MKTIRRNSVVRDNLDRTFICRVWKLVGADRALIIDCGYLLKDVPLSQLTLLEYSGRWTSKRSVLEKTHFLGMSRLRSLIKGTKYYNPHMIPIK